jgi:hypothetical protein
MGVVVEMQRGWRDSGALLDGSFAPSPSRPSPTPPCSPPGPYAPSLSAPPDLRAECPPLPQPNPPTPIPPLRILHTRLSSPGPGGRGCRLHGGCSPGGVAYMVGAVHLGLVRRERPLERHRCTSTREHQPSAIRGGRMLPARARAARASHVLQPCCTPTTSHASAAATSPHAAPPSPPRPGPSTPTI